MATTTITTKTKIAYNNLLHTAKRMSDLVFEQDEIKSLITYRRYCLTTDSLPGDLNRQTYTDYQLYAGVHILLVDDRIVQQGEMMPGDCELFIKPYIDREYNGTEITSTFEPQIDDEIIFNNIRFRIKLIRVERAGNTKVYLDCLCSRLENDNPEHEWNTNYREPATGGRRGSGWS